MTKFQYRKRYEVYCNAQAETAQGEQMELFQYRKRYEVYCNSDYQDLPSWNWQVSIPQAV